MSASTVRVSRTIFSGVGFYLTGFRESEKRYFVTYVWNYSLKYDAETKKAWEKEEIEERYGSASRHRSNDDANESQLFGNRK